LLRPVPVSLLTCRPGDGITVNFQALTCCRLHAWCPPAPESSGLLLDLRIAGALTQRHTHMGTAGVLARPAVSYRLISALRQGTTTAGSCMYCFTHGESILRLCAWQHLPAAFAAGSHSAAGVHRNPECYGLERAVKALRAGHPDGDGTCNDSSKGQCQGQHRHKSPQCRAISGLVSIPLLQCLAAQQATRRDACSRAQKLARALGPVALTFLGSFARHDQLQAGERSLRSRVGTGPQSQSTRAARHIAEGMAERQRRFCIGVIAGGSSQMHACTPVCHAAVLADLAPLPPARKWLTVWPHQVALDGDFQAACSSVTNAQRLPLPFPAGGPWTMGAAGGWSACCSRLP